MLNGLDLFSGIGGISLALRDYVRPIAYCEIDPYCHGVLLSRMADQYLLSAPIWNDIRTLRGSVFRGEIEIIYGGFPCQGFSVAGVGKGLEDERSGLFFEIVRLAKEIKPKFIFIENVPAITSRGGLRVVREIAEMGYDCRWCCISAASVGAPHKRERWFLLAHAHDDGSSSLKIIGGSEACISDTPKGAYCSCNLERMDSSRNVAPESIAHSTSTRCPRRRELPIGNATTYAIAADENISSYWQETESPLCGMDDGVPNRVDRIRGLGNAVVPVQVKEAFEILMGIYGSDG